jgi:hypothetical protein
VVDLRISVITPPSAGLPRAPIRSTYFTNIKGGAWNTFEPPQRS